MSDLLRIGSLFDREWNDMENSKSWNSLDIGLVQQCLVHLGFCLSNNVQDTPKHEPFGKSGKIGIDDIGCQTWNLISNKLFIEIITSMLNALIEPMLKNWHYNHLHIQHQM